MWGNMATTKKNSNLYFCLIAVKRNIAHNIQQHFSWAPFSVTTQATPSDFSSIAPNSSFFLHCPWFYLSFFWYLSFITAGFDAIYLGGKEGPKGGCCLCNLEESDDIYWNRKQRIKKEKTDNIEYLRLLKSCAVFLDELSYLIFTTNQWKGYYYNPHFIDK